MGSAKGGSDGVVRRKTGRFVIDPDAGTKRPEWQIVHSGPFRLRGARGGAAPSRRIEQTGGAIEVGTPEAHWPIDVDVLRDGDFIETAAGPNAGRVWRIVDANVGDQQTARRYRVIEEQRPEEWS